MNNSEYQSILYNTIRNKRFEKFIELYDSDLKNDVNLCFRIFREAYCSTDNIFNQIKNSGSSFDIKKFLTDNQKNGINFTELMTDKEKEFYKNLPDKLIVYRGAGQDEIESKNYGISWSLSEEEAGRYISFGPNNVDNDKGQILKDEIDKKDIITVFSVYESFNCFKNEIIHITEGQ